MKQCAFLRGINVGGKRKLRMADLKAACADLGWTDFSTYIQSGNLLFNADIPASEAAAQLEQCLHDHFQLDVPVVALEIQTLQEYILNNPFVNEGCDQAKLHLAFLKAAPTTEALARLEDINRGDDRFVFHKEAIYLCCEGPYHQTKLSNQAFESRLKVGVTTRNWRTVMKMLELVRGL